MLGGFVPGDLLDNGRWRGSRLRRWNIRPDRRLVQGQPVIQPAAFPVQVLQTVLDRDHGVSFKLPVPVLEVPGRIPKRLIGGGFDLVLRGPGDIGKPGRNLCRQRPVFLKQLLRARPAG